jgi:hypothetical protein
MVENILRKGSVKRVCRHAEDIASSEIRVDMSGMRKNGPTFEAKCIPLGESAIKIGPDKCFS